MLLQKLWLRRSEFLFFPFISMIFSFAAAVLSPMAPLFIEEIVHNTSLVGYIFASISLFTIIFEFLVTPLICRSNPFRLLQFSFLGLGLSFFVFPFVHTLAVFYPLIIIRVFFYVLILLSLGLFVRASATDGRVGDEEGVHYSLVNFAWLIGPLVGGFVGQAYGVRSVFWISGILCLLPVLILHFRHQDKKVCIASQQKIHWLSTFKEYFSQRRLRVLYYSAASLTGFSTVMLVFLPLFLDNYGIAKSAIGFVFFIEMLPLFMFEMYTAHLGERYGTRPMLLYGFIIMGIFAALLAFAHSYLLLLLLLFLAYIGMSLIEPNHETRFFHTVQFKDEIRYYAVYKSALQVGSLLSLVLVSTLLLFFPLLPILFFFGLYYVIFALLFLRN